MNPSKCDVDLYVQFLLAACGSRSCVELSRVSPFEMAHDAVNRMLCREDLTPESVWEAAKSLVDVKRGYLIVDDTVLDKPYAQKMELVRWQWSGLHHDVVKGIGLITLLWSDGVNHVPVDFRVYNPDCDGKTKNQHFLDMLETAVNRGFQPKWVLLDAWYASLENLKTIRKLGWRWFAQLKKNRVVNYGEHLEELTIPEGGLAVHLRKYGFIQVFRTALQNGDVKYYGSSDTQLHAEEFDLLKTIRWRIEEYHRGLKQHTGVNRCQLRSATAQIKHITCSILAFIKLEITRIKHTLSWNEQKNNITRHAIKHYLKQHTPNA
jgi:hypothetical protein